MCASIPIGMVGCRWAGSEIHFVLKTPYNGLNRAKLGSYKGLGALLMSYKGLIACQGPLGPRNGLLMPWREAVRRP